MKNMMKVALVALMLTGVLHNGVACAAPSAKIGMMSTIVQAVRHNRVFAAVAGIAVVAGIVALVYKMRNVRQPSSEDISSETVSPRCDCYGRRV